MPSPAFFVERFGIWNVKVMPADLFQPTVFAVGPTAAGNSATASPKSCPSAAVDLLGASRRCGGYDPGVAPGKQSLPVFEVRDPGGMLAVLACWGRLLLLPPRPPLLYRSSAKLPTATKLTVDINPAHLPTDWERHASWAGSGGCRGCVPPAADSQAGPACPVLAQH